MQKVELVTMNGDVITTFTREELDGVRVEDFIDDLEQDDMIGVEGAKHDDLGVFVERFCLVIRDEIMQVDSCSHLWVTDYFPEGEESIRITLLKQPVEEAIYKEQRRDAELEVVLGSPSPLDPHTWPRHEFR